jgi:multidrug efflux pump subunit AcrA (membrane-fusion protein)
MAINKKTVGGLILAALLLLIFFSNTIYTYNLPVVTAVRPHNGRLSKIEVSRGVADFAEVQNVYIELAGIAEEVLVKEGDFVEEGQELLRLSFDRDEAERRLMELENSRNKLKNDIENINLRLARIERNVRNLEAEVYTADEVSRYELEQLDFKIRTTRARLQDQLVQFGYSLEANILRNELDSLIHQQANIEENMRKRTEDARENVREQERARRTRLADYKSDKEILIIELSQKEIDLDNLTLQEQPHRRALRDFSESAVVTSPADGYVIRLDVSKGEAVRANHLAAVIGEAGGFIVVCNVPLDNNFIAAGDTCELSNTSHILRGVVTKVTPVSNGKTVTVSVASDEVTAGETFDVTFRKDSTVSYILVPNGAVNQDNDGYFVNQVRRRDGILGKEFYLNRVNVYIGDSDARNTVITQGVRFFEPLALVSDKPVSPGDTIVLANAGEFFD